MNKQAILSIALGSALMGSAVLSHAADNPFAAHSLSQGYQLAQADKKVDGKCGEAKCGADKARARAEKKQDGKCGEAKCGADKAAKSKQKDGKCGEAKCGADKKAAPHS